MRVIFSILFIFSGFIACTQNLSSGKSVVFKIKNFGVTIVGSFASPTGLIHFDSSDPSNSIFDVTIKSESINTGIDLRDKHLKGKDYLDVNVYPEIRFKSKSVTKDDKMGKWIVVGDLKIKNVVKQVSFPFTIIDGILLGNVTIDRRDFNVGGKSLSMSDSVEIELRIANQKL